MRRATHFDITIKCFFRLLVDVVAHLMFSVPMVQPFEHNWSRYHARFRDGATSKLNMFCNTVVGPVTKVF